MKKIQLIALCLLGSILVTAGLTGCASTMCCSEKEDMLSAAGFAALTPHNADQEAAYAKMKSYKMQTGVVKGKRLYGFKDEKKGVVYVGGSSQYMAYKKLKVEQNMTTEKMEAAEMNNETIGYYNTFGPNFYWQ